MTLRKIILKEIERLNPASDKPLTKLLKKICKEAKKKEVK